MDRATRSRERAGEVDLAALRLAMEREKIALEREKVRPRKLWERKKEDDEDGY